MVTFITQTQYNLLSSRRKQAFWDDVNESGFSFQGMYITDDDDWNSVLSTFGKVLWWDAFSREFNPRDSRPPAQLSGGGGTVPDRETVDPPIPDDGLGEINVRPDIPEEEIQFVEDGLVLVGSQSGPTGLVIKNPYEDMLGIGSAFNGPTIGPATSDDARDFHVNIDDPRYTIARFKSDPLSLGRLPALEVEEVTCDDRCAQQKAERVKKCNVLRKRVALALKKAGCPSKVTPHKRVRVKKI